VTKTYLILSGQIIKANCISYSTEVNNLFLDIVSDTGLEQYGNLPAHQGTILCLVLSTNSITHDLEVVPGMPDYDAIV